MISKFSEIKNLAVYQNFKWDECVKDKNGTTIAFDKINIIYGQNYAGKTTLSRIIRSLETGHFSDKYGFANFVVKFQDGAELTNNQLGTNQRNIRVFNDDFVRDNLAFIIDPEASINSFAVLGEKNNQIEKEIEKLQEVLGDEKSSTGLYKILNDYRISHKSLSAEVVPNEKRQQKSLSEKATGKEIGIKYNYKYDKINYDINALKSDIESVKEKTFVPLSQDEALQNEQLLLENTKENIKEIQPPVLNFDQLQESVSSPVTKVVGKSDKIDFLLRNAIMNRWVKEGMNLHEPNSSCGFCGGLVTEERWKELERHFDEESENLEKEIRNTLAQIDSEIETVTKISSYQEHQFYNKFSAELNKIQNEVIKSTANYVSSLEILKKHLLDRKNEILNAKDYDYLSDPSLSLKHEYERLEDLRKSSNHYTLQLDNDKKIAKENLRLRDVYEYLIEIDYDSTNSYLKKLKDRLFDLEQDEIAVSGEINRTLQQIEAYKKEIEDESKGAEIINYYLENFFGHFNLKIVAFEEDTYWGTETKFKIQRNGSQAFHLSEGEKSLIAFCYFIAKLQESQTKGLKPIIWIDDPISSLDGNHIFYIYSLLKSELYEKKDFEQIFISTHNLNFLKYLKRLPSHNDYKDNKVKHFLIERLDQVSAIKEMPKYLREHVTEFNHLFKNIYECANLKSVDDSNYMMFYNFGNNARKFLEIYLFYRYPNFENEDSKYKKFFGQDNIPSILTGRMVNEYSHLCGNLERGEIPIEEPEMKRTAQLILKKIEENDKDQFEALVKSII